MYVQKWRTPIFTKDTGDNLHIAEINGVSESGQADITTQQHRMEPASKHLNITLEYIQRGRSGSHTQSIQSIAALLTALPREMAKPAQGDLP